MTPKALELQPAAPGTDCNDRPLKITCHIQMMSPNSAPTVAGKVIDKSLHPAQEKINALPITTLGSTAIAYTILKQFAIAKQNSNLPHPLSQQTHHEHHEPQWMKTHSLITIPSLINHQTELSSIHSAPCPHPLPTMVANVPSAWTSTPIISSQIHRSGRPPNLNPLSKSLLLSQPAITKLLGSQSQSK